MKRSEERSTAKSAMTHCQVGTNRLPLSGLSCVPEAPGLCRDHVQSGATERTVGLRRSCLVTRRLFAHALRRSESSVSWPWRPDLPTFQTSGGTRAFLVWILHAGWGDCSRKILGTLNTSRTYRSLHLPASSAVLINHLNPRCFEPRRTQFRIRGKYVGVSQLTQS